jgi:putative ABC transport system permease protein
MNGINQVFSITWMNLRNLPARFGASMVIVVGIAGVVAVLVALLSMAKGFEATLQSTGDPGRILVLRGGSNTEMASSVCTSCFAALFDKPGVLRNEQGAMIAGETYVIANIAKRANNSEANLPLRGVQPNSFLIRDEVKIVEGRNLEFGKFELIAGVKAADQFKGLDVGNRLSIRGADWEVVGLFDSGGSIHESETWVDNTLLVSNINRVGYGAAVVQLESPQDFDVFQQALKDDVRLELEAIKVTKYYNEASKGVTSLITGFGYGVGIIMAIGAIFGALNTMYSAVSTRGIEIATLRALGFGPVPIVISVMVEALLLSMLGGAIGATIAYVFFNGYTASTMGGTFSQVSFDFAVTGELIVRGIIWSCVLGTVGGLFPSISAARQPITVALRGM